MKESIFDPGVFDGSLFYQWLVEFKKLFQQEHHLGHYSLVPKAPLLDFRVFVTIIVS